jgi:hypothetical protein
MPLGSRCSNQVIAGLTALLLLAAIPASANVISLTGALDPNNPNDALLIAFSLSGAANVDMQSYGFGGSGQAPGGTNANDQVIAPGGFDTYFSLFQGTGPGATFLVSNDDGACPPGDGTVVCRDSTLNQSLSAGSYTLAVSVFNNFSFAENLASGTLGDGFIELGSYFNSDIFGDTTSAYAVDIVADGLTLIDAHRLSDVTSPVPEPSTAALVAAALLAAAHWKRLRTAVRKEKLL